VGTVKRLGVRLPEAEDKEFAETSRLPDLAFAKDDLELSKDERDPVRRAPYPPLPS
jgi:hypothetical protein